MLLSSFTQKKKTAAVSKIFDTTPAWAIVKRQVWACVCDSIAVAVISKMHPDWWFEVPKYANCRLQL